MIKDKMISDPVWNNYFVLNHFVKKIQLRI